MVEYSNVNNNKGGETRPQKQIKMKSEKSINQNGCSVCEKGKEKYTTFCVGTTRKAVYYQYDYRYTDGELFSTVAKSLDECRERRDKRLQKKHFTQLFPSTLKQIQENKRLTKSDMAYQIGHIAPLHPVSISWDILTRDDIVMSFNKIFGTEIT
jgi:hypothetical protein